MTTSLRIEKKLGKEFRKWLIENNYKSFHQFVVECMEKALRDELEQNKRNKDKRTFKSGHSTLCIPDVGFPSDNKFL